MADPRLLGAESASDGTTVVMAEKAAWLCRPEPAACVPVERKDLLAARPLPGGRALLAIRGAGTTSSGWSCSARPERRRCSSR